MSKRKFGIGGLGIASLVLAVVILSMSVLAMLTLMTARSDDRLSRRSAQITESIYALYDLSERSFARLDTNACQSYVLTATEEDFLARVESELPEGMIMEGDLIIWEETDGVRSLHCEVRVKRDPAQRLTWEACQLISQTGDDTEWN